MSGILNMGSLRTLLDRLTSARAIKLDNLDATITSRASATHYTSTRAAKLDNLDAAISGIPTSPIASIQRGNSVISSGSSTQDFTISAVDTSKSFVLGHAFDRDADFFLHLENATTLRAQRSGTAGGFSFRWQVIEFV